MKVNYKKRVMLISWLVVIIWMSVIFYLSDQIASESAGLSTGVTEWLLKIIGGIVDNFNIDIESVHHMIRKNAHFIVYCVLGIVVINAIKNSGITGFKRYSLAILICILYALSDEFHQMFIPGRSAELKDVLIDSAGAASGIVLWWFRFRST